MIKFTQTQITWTDVSIKLVVILIFISMMVLMMRGWCFRVHYHLSLIFDYRRIEKKKKIWWTRRMNEMRLKEGLTRKKNQIKINWIQFIEWKFYSTFSLLYLYGSNAISPNFSRSLFKPFIQLCPRNFVYCKHSMVKFLSHIHNSFLFSFINNIHILCVYLCLSIYFLLLPLSFTVSFCF